MSATDGMNPMVAAMLENLQRGYEERVTHVARTLQATVDGLRTDPVLRQLAIDADSALHMSAHVEEVVRHALGREQERAAKKALQRAAHAEARCVLMENAMADLKLQMQQLRQRNDDLAASARDGAGRRSSPVDALLSQVAENSLMLASPRAGDADRIERLERERRDDREALAGAREENTRFRAMLEAQEREIEALNAKKLKLKTALRRVKERGGANDDESTALREEVRWLTEERMQMSEQYSRLATKLELLAASKEHRNEGLRGKLTDVTQQHNAMLNTYVGMKDEVAALHEEVRVQAAAVAAREQTIGALQRDAAAFDSERHRAERTIAELKSDVAAAKAELKQHEEKVREYEMSKMVEQRLRPMMEATEKQRKDDDSLQQSMRNDQFNAVVATCKATIENLERRNDELTKQLEQVTEQAKADLLDMSQHLKTAGEQRQRAECTAAEANTRCKELEKQLELAESKAENVVECRLLKEETERLRRELREQAQQRKQERSPPSPNTPHLQAHMHHLGLPPAGDAAQLQGMYGSVSALQAAGLPQGLGGHVPQPQSPKKKKQDTEADHTECRQRVAEMESRIQKLKGERAAEQQQQEAAHQHLEQMQQQLMRAEERLGEARGEVVRLQSVVATLEGAVATERNYKAEAQKQLDEIINETTAAEAAEAVDYTKWMQEHQELVQLRVRSAKVPALEADLKKARADVARLTAEVEALEREKAAAAHQQEIADMRKKNLLDRERQEVERLRQQLADMQADRDAVMQQASRVDLNKSIEEKQNQKEMQKFVYYFQKELQKELSVVKDKYRGTTEELHAAHAEIQRLRTSRDTSPPRAMRLDDTALTTRSTGSPSIRVELREAAGSATSLVSESESPSTDAGDARHTRQPTSLAAATRTLRVGDLGLQHMQQAVANIAAAASSTSSNAPGDTLRTRTSSATSSKGAFIR